MPKWEQLKMDLGIPMPEPRTMAEIFGARVIDTINKFSRIISDLGPEDLDDLLLRMDDLLEDFDGKSS